MKYGTYNDELGYSNGPQFDTPFEAVEAAWGRCRQHHVIEYDDNGKFVRNLTPDEEVAIFHEHKAQA